MRQLILALIQVLFVIIYTNIQAQDTLIHKDKTISVVKIFEVGITEVKYKRFDNLQGPTYFINKSDLFCIKYANGTGDTIQMSFAAKVPEETPSISSSKKLEVVDNKIFYGDEQIGYNELRFLIDNYPDKNIRLKLQEEFDVLKSYDIKIRVVSPILFAVGFAVPAVTSVYSVGALFDTATEADVAPIFITGVIAGAAMRISSQVINKVNRHKRLSQKRKIAQLFNGVIHN